MSSRFLTALPVFNEVKSVCPVLDEVANYSDDMLVVDDGSTDGTLDLLRQRKDITLIEHQSNQGYGGALITAFDYAIENNYDVLVTIDCDGQHEPQLIRRFVAESASTGADIISGSRYLKTFSENSSAPKDRRNINKQITDLLNEKLGYSLTDSFCGFKAYRVEALRKLKLTETGYAMPLELWVQAWCQQLTVQEVPVPLIYLDEDRSFGDNLDDPTIRLNYYHEILRKAFSALPNDCPKSRQGESVGL
jgi:dolichol-phosphate mannosyltransferase